MLLLRRQLLSLCVFLHSNYCQKKLIIYYLHIIGVLFVLLLLGLAAQVVNSAKKIVLFADWPLWMLLKYLI